MSPGVRPTPGNRPNRFSGIVQLFLSQMGSYCIVLYLLPVLNPKSYDGARVLEASGRPMLVIGRSYFDSIQAVWVTKGVETVETEVETVGTEVETVVTEETAAGTKLIA